MSSTAASPGFPVARTVPTKLQTAPTLGSDSRRRASSAVTSKSACWMATRLGMARFSPTVPLGQAPDSKTRGGWSEDEELDGSRGAGAGAGHGADAAADAGTD